MNISCKDQNKEKKVYLAPVIKIVNVRSQVSLIAYSGTFGLHDVEKEHFA